MLQGGDDRFIEDRLLKVGYCRQGVPPVLYLMLLGRGSSPKCWRFHLLNCYFRSAKPTPVGVAGDRHGLTLCLVWQVIATASPCASDTEHTMSTFQAIRVRG